MMTKVICYKYLLSQSRIDLLSSMKSFRETITLVLVLVTLNHFSFLSKKNKKKEEIYFPLPTNNEFKLDIINKYKN